LPPYLLRLRGGSFGHVLLYQRFDYLASIPTRSSAHSRGSGRHVLRRRG
jgi:hypothetical protein